MKKSTKILVALTAVLLLVFGIGTYLILTEKQDSRIAKVYVGDELLYEIDLQSVNEPYTITVTGENGKENVIEVRQGEIGVISASCPDKLCVECGFSGSRLLPIICLPNDVMICVEGGESDVDARH